MLWLIQAKQLEAAGAVDGYSWRGGQKHRPQRWAEYVQLLKAIEAGRDRLTQQAREAPQQPQDVALVGPVEAALELDAQRELLQLSLCEFREFLNHTGKEVTGKGIGRARRMQLHCQLSSWGSCQQTCRQNCGRRSRQLLSEQAACRSVGILHFNVW